jgi:hypothetical protein
MARWFRVATFAGVAVVLALVGQAGIPERAAEAVFPGDNGRIAYVAGFPGEIRTVNPDGSGDVPLISPGRSPAWSADGKHIAFTRFASNSQDLWMARADGGDEQLVVEGGYDPAWSPDGTKIAFVRRAEECPNAPQATGGGISIVDVASGPPFTQTILTEDCETPSPNFTAFSPEWSPDGTQIYFLRWSEVSFEYEVLWVIGANGGVIVRVADGYNAIDAFSLSPDGEEVALYARKGDIDSTDEGVFVYNFADDEARKVREYAEARPNGLSWSPDGSRIAYISREGDSGVGNLKTMNPQGADVRDVIAAASDPAWGPDAGLVEEVEFTQGAQKVQSLGELKADLEADGKPPVPIVAGKQAVMRVYFPEVEENVTYIVDSNLTDDDITMHLEPGCDEIERRSGEDDCKSADFHFQPPTGQWTAELFIKNTSGEILEEHEFTLNSTRSPGLTIIAISVCDVEETPHVWLCGDHTRVNRHSLEFQSMVPTDSVTVVRHPGLLLRPRSGDSSDRDWWRGVTRDLEALYMSEGAQQIYAGRVIYVGVVREDGPSSVLGMAPLGAHAAAYKEETTTMGVEDTAETLAHELGHALGSEHTNKATPVATTRPGCYGLAQSSDATWPEEDNHLYTVGFDVPLGETRPGTEWFEIMAYCGPQWISTYTTMEWLTGLGSAGATAAPAGAGEGGLLVSGALTEGGVDFAPLKQVPMPSAASASGGTSGGAEDQYSINGMNDAEEIVFANTFVPFDSSFKPEPGFDEGEGLPIFSVVVPDHPDVVALALMRESEEIGRIELTGNGPTVALNFAPAGTVTGEQLVEWTITDPDSSEHWSTLEYSSDGGAAWQTVAQLPDDGLLLDFDALPGSNNAMLRVHVSDGLHEFTATSGTFVVGEKLPEASIIAPEGGLFRLGQVVALRAEAFDADGDVTVTWSSSKDGNLGSGAGLDVYDLSLGSHTITMTARDSDNNTVTDTVSITVVSNEISEGEPVGELRVWGDNDCNGAISSRDNQALTRFILGQAPLSQTQPCPVVGASVTLGGNPPLWGDVDCSGSVGARDGQALLRNVLGQPPLSQTQPCPAIGETVAVVVALTALTKRLF